MDEEDHVSILLDRARFAQVTHDGLLVLALLHLPRELRQRDDGTLQLLGQRLQRTRDLAHLGGPVLATARVGTRHQLQVVNDDEPQVAVLACQASGTGPQLEGVERRRLVDEHRRILHLTHGIGQPDEVVLGQPAGTQPLLIDAPRGADQTHHQLLGAHLHTEDGHRQLLVHGHVLTDVERKGRLTHRRAGRHNDQVTGLHAGGHPVQVHEASGNAGDLAGVVAVVEFVDALEDLARQRTDVLEVVALLAAVLGNLEHLGLSRVQHLVHRTPLGVEGLGGDLVGDGNQPTQHGTVTHHLGVVADVAGRDDGIGQHRQVLLAAGILQPAGLLQRVLHGQRIGRSAGTQQVGDVLPYHPVIMPIEVIIGDDVGNIFPGAVVQQQPAQHRLLGLDRMRRQPQLCNLAIHGMQAFR